MAKHRKQARSRPKRTMPEAGSTLIEHQIAVVRDLRKRLDLIGKKVRTRRHNQRLSGSEAAAEAGMSPTQWYRIENGRTKDIKLSTLMRMARVLGCYFWELL